VNGLSKGEKLNSDRNTHTQTHLDTHTQPSFALIKRMSRRPSLAFNYKRDKENELPIIHIIMYNTYIQMHT